MLLTYNLSLYYHYYYQLEYLLAIYFSYNGFYYIYSLINYTEFRFIYPEKIVIFFNKPFFIYLYICINQSMGQKFQFKFTI